MDNQVLKRRTSLQYLEGIFLVAVTVTKTAQTTARALLDEHPYALMFLLVFGIFLFPLSTTAIAGTLFLVLSTAGIIFISVVFFAPALFLLTIVASAVWLFSAMLLGIYRYIIASQQEPSANHLSARYKMYRSTLEDQAGTYSQHQIMTAIATSTPEKEELKGSLRALRIGSGRDGLDLDPERRTVSAQLKELTAPDKTNIETHSSKKSPGSDFFPRESTDMEGIKLGQRPAAAAAEPTVAA